MVTPSLIVNLRGPSKLPPDDNADILVKPSLVEIFDQGAHALVEHGHVLAASFEISSVPVPAAESQGHASGSGLNESPGHQELFHETRPAIGDIPRNPLPVALTNPGVLLLDVKSPGQLAGGQDAESLAAERVHPLHGATRVD